MIWSRIIGVLVALLAFRTIYKGRLMTSDDYGNSEVIDRAKSPVWFWIVVAGQFVLAALLILNVFNF